MSPLGVFKAKDEEKVKKKNLFFFDQGKNQFAHFVGTQKKISIYFHFEFFGNCS